MHDFSIISNIPTEQKTYLEAVTGKAVRESHPILQQKLQRLRGSTQHRQVHRCGLKLGPLLDS